MSMSIEELDKTVRTFYEGRGDVVSVDPLNYARFCAVKLTFVCVAKTSTADDESGT
jgi:hypothetical protein